MFDFKIKPASEAREAWCKKVAAEKALYEQRLQPVAVQYIEEIERSIEQYGKSNCYFSSSLPKMYNVPKEAVKDLARSMNTALRNAGYSVDMEITTSVTAANLAILRISI